MSAKKSTNVIIGNKMYTLSGYEEEEYLHKVATYINHKIEEVEKLDNYKQLSTDMKTVMLNLNLADDYFKAKDRVESNEQDLKHKDQEIYNLKHELVTNQVTTEELEKQISDLKEENQELKLHKAKLEASLEDALLGTGDSGSDEF
ncbi:MAG: cell division protein ZapA [Lachnospiraceae bacterium]|jgi:cell division protein ZapA|nr:cell division protein ZapA [Lachnospiraceae bacterium]